jgi:hypothetical protein
MHGVGLKIFAGKSIDFVSSGFQPNPYKVAQKLGWRLGLKFTSKRDLVRKLRQVPFPEILRNTPPTLVVPRASIPFDYGPVRETQWSTEPTFFDKSPEQIYRSGAFKELPLLTGSNSVSTKVSKRFDLIEMLSDFRLKVFSHSTNPLLIQKFSKSTKPTLNTMCPSPST